MFFSLSAKASEEKIYLGPFTEFPLATGAEGKLNVTNYAHIRSRFGYVLSSYITVVNKVCKKLGYYNDDVAGLVQELIPGSSYLEFAIGFDDVPVNGIFIDFGISFFAGGGGATTKGMMDRILGSNLDFLSSALDRLEIEGNIRSFTAHLGYVWKVGPRWRITPALGFIKPLSSTTRMKSEGLPEFLLMPFNVLLDGYMDKAYSKVFLPTLSLSATFEL